MLAKASFLQARGALLLRLGAARLSQQHASSTYSLAPGLQKGGARRATRKPVAGAAAESDTEAPAEPVETAEQAANAASAASFKALGVDRRLLVSGDGGSGSGGGCRAGRRLLLPTLCAACPLTQPLLTHQTPSTSLPPAVFLGAAGHR